MTRKVTEQLLTDVFRAGIRSEVDGVCPRFAHITEEMSCKQGRPDLVASVARLSHLTRSRREALSSALIQPATARIISILKYDAPRTEDYVSRVSGLERRVVRKGIGDLSVSRLVRRSGGGFILSSTFPRNPWELWAFELKLQNSKRAFYQALQYRAFAHRVAVVVPECWLRQFEGRIEHFNKLHVGLISVNLDTARLRFVLRPRKRPPMSRFHYLYAVGKFLRAVP